VVAEINITPLTDVFLVLLIIFMVTSTALVESEVASRAGMKVVLPKANAAGPVSQKRSDPVLTVTRANELYLGSRKLDPSNLEARFARRWPTSGPRRCSSAGTRTSISARRSTSCRSPRRPAPRRSRS
jgi:biopolymer transport protein ExbD